MTIIPFTHGQEAQFGAAWARAFVGPDGRSYQGMLVQGMSLSTGWFELDPAYALAYRSRGLARSALGLHTEAIADYNEAIRLDLDDVVVYYNPDIAKKISGLCEEARKDLDVALYLAGEASNADQVAAAQ